jgi:hypothetical protein
MNWFIHLFRVPFCSFYGPGNNGIRLRLWTLVYFRHKNSIYILPNSSACCVIMRKLMLSCGTNCYHVVSSGAHVIVWSKFDHMASYVIMWDELLSCGTNCYHVGQYVTMWDQMLSPGAYAL